MNCVVYQMQTVVMQLLLVRFVGLRLCLMVSMLCDINKFVIAFMQSRESQLTISDPFLISDFACLFNKANTSRTLLFAAA